MNETQRRIKAYQSALPGLRERVLAVALLLVMSITMMTSATFAWLTISRAPEVSGVNTTVAANGNLEIALANSNDTAPGESKVGDSSAAKGQTVTAANLTWGNLVNLSDESYGLENLTLRPAQLNTASLLNSPLYGAVYGKDGRITKLTSNFGYATWNMPDGDKPGYFGVSEQYGVRAISSTKIEAVGAEQVYIKMVSNADETNALAGQKYLDIANDSNYMPSLATMMGLYMTARMNPSDDKLSNPTCDIADVQNLRDMYADFLEAFDKEAEALAALVNLQLFLRHGEGQYTPYTADMIYATTPAQLKAEGIQISKLDEFIDDRDTIASDFEKLKDLCSSGTSLTWKDSGLNTIVNNLVDVGACTIGKENTPISSIGASNAASYITGTQEAKITNGILYRFEERTGVHINVQNLSISATVSRGILTIPASVKANITTTASKDYYLFNNDMNYAKSLNTGNYQGGIAVAEDTYGLAIDLWVRTNAQGSYLTLEGNILTESEDVEVTGKDANGNEVNIYTVTQTVEDDEGNSTSFSTDLYKIETTDADGNVTTAWYNATSHTEVALEEGVTPTLKMEKLVTVIGFEGENRVWNGNSNTLLSTDSTTQGSGSCYVYYADTPEDQARSLQLLDAFNVAFVDGNGKLLATAEMDTEHYYAVSGRVIVPLVLSTSNSINLGEDYEGNTTYAITSLEKNTPTRITAIVYLDGTKLTNDEVLAAADIQGQLNIQFGSTVDLNSLRNETLENAERSVSASVDKTAFNYDTDDDMTTKVTVQVSGEEPSKVTAFFMRQINSTQGSREKTITFTKNETSGVWEADYTFTAPGNYVLRTVQLDGQDYVLADCPTVNIEGFAITSLTCTQATDNHINIMTAANSSTVDLQLRFATDDVSRLPKTVQGRFLREDGSATNINFTYNATTGIWSGSATFLTSGDYTLQYLVLDGNYTELPSTLWQTASVTLGMKVAVYTTSPWRFKYVPSEMEENQKLLDMRVKIMDNTGKEMPGLTGAKLIYSAKGSGIKTMDTDLVWNGTYYEGELKTLESGGPGTWQFSTVTVGSNTITSATTSPTFTIMSAEPPEYYTHATAAYQYAPNHDAQMNVQITNSAAATVQAYIIKDGASEGTWVYGNIGGEYTNAEEQPVNHWYFTIPQDSAGKQDEGTWYLTALKLWDVFDKDGNAYTAESPLEIDVSAKGIQTKVANKVYITFETDRSQNFGTDANGNVTGAFMDSHTISNLGVDIKDFEGNAFDVTDVKLEFVYNNDSEKYGGYTSSSLTNAVADFSIDLLGDDTGTHFAQSGTQTIQYAGSYATTLSFQIAGVSYKYSGDTLPVNAPVFTVSSVTPTVTISAISPTGSNATKITYTTTNIAWYLGGGTQPTFTATGNQTSSFSDYAATLYAVATADNSSQRHGSFTQPTLTMTVAGVDSSSAVSIVLPGGSASAITFSRTGNGAITKTLGSVSQIKSWTSNVIYTHTLSAYYGHGTQTISTMTVTRNGLTYTVYLENPIVINNPSSVNQ